ncbi:MAG: hypothetical protein WCP09_01310 [Candidatus Taylorbacteria bacterium]
MNKPLKKIFNSDQKDRHDKIVCNDASLLSKCDRERKKLVCDLISKKMLVSADDYYHAAMIFHHGSSIQDSTKAVRLSKISYKLGYKKALSLYAMCLDRLLLKKSGKQKFGTQYKKKNSKSMWRLLPVDPRTSDAERKKYNIGTLKELEKHVERLNKVTC